VFLPLSLSLPLITITTPLLCVLFLQLVSCAHVSSYCSLPHRSKNHQQHSKPSFLLVPSPPTTLLASPAALPPGGTTICRYRNSPIFITKPFRVEDTPPPFSFFTSRLCYRPLFVHISLFFFFLFRSLVINPVREHVRKMTPPDRAPTPRL